MQQSLGVLIQLVGGEQLRHARGDSFDFLEKSDRVRDRSFADDGGEDDLVFGIEGDPNPTVAQDSQQLLDRIQMLFLFADKRPHLVELTFADPQLLQPGPADGGGMSGGFRQNEQHRLVVHVLNASRGTDPHPLGERSGDGLERVVGKVRTMQCGVASGRRPGSRRAPSDEPAFRIQEQPRCAVSPQGVGKTRGHTETSIQSGRACFLIEHLCQVVMVEEPRVWACARASLEGQGELRPFFPNPTFSTIRSTVRREHSSWYRR